jgi:hydrogenase-4 membrane subunit HyfE
MTADLLVLAAGSVLIVSSRSSVVLAAYVVLAITASVFIAPATTVSTLAFALFLLTTILKVAVAPAVLVWFVKAHPGARDLRSSSTLPARLVLAIVIAAAASGFAQSPLAASLPLLKVVVFVVACGLGMLLVHRNLIAHIIALLVLGTGVTLCGAVFAPQLPEAVELGATFDVLVGTFIGLALIRALVARDAVLDVETLRSLRG